VWKVLTAVFAVAAIGFAIWAITLNNDLQSTEDSATGEIATLQGQNEELTQQVTDLEEDVTAAEAETAVVTEEAGQALRQAVDAIDVAAGGLAVQD